MSITYSMQQSPSWEADQSSQLTKKFPAFYGTRRFFTVLTSARHPYLHIKIISLFLQLDFAFFFHVVHREQRYHQWKPVSDCSSFQLGKFNYKVISGVFTRFALLRPLCWKYVCVTSSPYTGTTFMPHSLTLPMPPNFMQQLLVHLRP
jgi:hypothetical protein